MTKNKELGDYGEEFAKKYFLEKGLRFIAKNFSYKHYEIDLIFEDEKKNQIIFIEVKTRSNDFVGLPEESINISKQEKLRKGAYYFLKLNKEFYNYETRFDSFSIIKNNDKFITNHIESAF